MRSPPPLSLRSLLLTIFLLTTTAVAQLTNDNCAHVIDATATLSTTTNTYTISATVSSPYETGWDQYADAWQVLDGDTILGTRALGHPHVTEQPFTRTLSGVEIPSTITSVTIQARDLINGYCGESFELELVNRGDVEDATTATTSEMADPTTTTTTADPATTVSLPSSTTSGAGTSTATASLVFVAGAVYHYGSTWN